MERRHDVARIPLVAWLALVAILLAIYGTSLGRGFVKDDVVWVGDNQIASWVDARKLMLRTDGFYRPVVSASFALDRALYDTRPFGFGVTNFCLLLFGTLALSFLAYSLGLNPTAAILAGAPWALNFHGVNMALLWLSGRTALWLSLWALLAACALVKRRPLLTGLAACLAMFSKEEAVLLPVILGGWAWVLSGADGQKPRERVRAVAQLTWPSLVALGVYLSMRAQTAAMTPFSSPAPYRFTMNPLAVLENGLEYFDRACTFSAMVLLVACLLSARRPRLTPTVKTVATLSAIWFCGALAVTVLLPVRSSLYALCPSIAAALLTGALLQDVWAQSTTRARTRLVIAAALVPVLLLPVYRTRNVRWTEIADLSAETFIALRQASEKQPTIDSLVFEDDPTTRRSFANTYGELLPDAVRLATGRDIPARIEAAGEERDEPPMPSTDGRNIRVVLSEGRVSLVE